MSRFMQVMMLLSLAGAFALKAEAQTAGLGLRPMRLELEAAPGKEKTASFMIEAPPSDNEVRGRLILSLTDWAIHEDTSVTYHDAGTQKNSASSWITFTPTDFTIASGQQRMVRVTAQVPADAAPGVYTSAIFVQERPPSKGAEQGEHQLYFRFRYVQTIYVIVPPVTKQGELEDVQFVTGSREMQMVCDLKNAGTLHLRPNISWFIRSGDKEVMSAKNVEATVLLPFKTTKETATLGTPLEPGEYEVEVQVDFHDGRPIQAMKRSVSITAAVKSN